MHLIIHWKATERELFVQFSPHPFDKVLKCSFNIGELCCQRERTHTMLDHHDI